jgi:hypothetical protein
VFRTNCATCHGSGAAGFEGKGYPNLLDDDWLWGGTMEDIHLTITHGIRNTTDADARYSEMPKFGADEILDATQIGQVVEHVLALSGQEHDAALATEGAVVFADNCNGLPHGRRLGRPGAGRAEADGCDLALRRLARGDHRDGHLCPLRRDAELEPAAERRRNPRRGLLRPQRAAVASDLGGDATEIRGLRAPFLSRRGAVPAAMHKALCRNAAFRSAKF